MAARSLKNSRDLKSRLVRLGDKLAFDWNTRRAFYRHLISQHGNGVNMEEVLETFLERLKRRGKVSATKIVADIARRMKDGASFTRAISSWIPSDEVSVINGGEIAGDLPMALELLIEAKLRIDRVRKALRSALVSPAIYGLAVYGMLWAIGKFVAPSLEQTLPEDKAHGTVLGLYMAADLANSWWVLLPPIVAVACVLLVVATLPTWTGRYRIMAERFFPWSFYRDMQGYVWLMGFSALLRAGVADVVILKEQKTIANPWLWERLHSLWWRMENGASMPEALMGKNKGMPSFEFPNPDIVDDIGSMHGFSDFPERIAKLAMQWADELEESTLAKARRFGFWMEMFMYGVMGLLVVAINSMASQVGNAPVIH